MSCCMIGEVLFYPCPCLNAAHILCYVVGLLYQRKDDAVLSILRSWRKQGQSQSVERNGNGTLGLVLDDGSHLHGSLHCGLRLNREKTFHPKSVIRLWVKCMEKQLTYQELLIACNICLWKKK